MTDKVADRESYLFVVKKLKDIFGHSAVPEWEVDKHTVERLLALLTTHEMRTQLAQQQLRDLRVRCDEYSEEARRMGACLDSVGLGAEHLSEGGKSCLRALSSAALALDCNPSLPALLAATGSMQEERNLLEAQFAALEGEREGVARRSAAVEAQLEAVRAAVQSAEKARAARESEASRQVQQLPYFASKKAEYEAGCTQCNEHLAAVGFDSELRHGRVAARFEALQKENGVEGDDAELAVFRDLEPDEDLARKRVQAAKETLALLKQQYAKQLQAITVPE